MRLKQGGRVTNIMGRWLPKTERDKRDAIIMRLHTDGVPSIEIAGQFGRSPQWVYNRLRLLKARELQEAKV